VIAGLNLAMDPYGTWGTPVMPVVSSTFFTAPRDRQLAWLRNRLKASPEPTWLLGSSRVLAGFDTCAVPEVQRVGLLSLNLSELQVVLGDVLPHATSPKRVLMEWALGTSEPLPPERQSLHRELLTLDTTRVSVAKFAFLAASRLGYGPSRTCEAHTSAAEFALAGLEALISTQYSVAAEIGPNVRVAWARTFQRLCATHQHEFVFFIGPMYASVETAREVRDLVERHAELGRSLVSELSVGAPRCQFAFIDLATPYIDTYAGRGQEPPAEDWQDVRHFRGPVGHQALRELLE